MGNDVEIRTHSPFQHAAVPRTPRGTPCAKSWDDPWIEQVEAVEDALGRRICGARLSSGRPCQVESEHDSGRCRYHGGFTLTGAPKGNRNAEIHALYSRRLRLCSRDCPLWSQCPCAGADVEDIHPALRPTCPFEQAEYDAALEEALALAATNPQPNPMAGHIAHNIAILQVLLNRAALALRNGQLTSSTMSTSCVDPNGAYVIETKPSAQLTAFVRIAGEYRRFAALLMPGKAPRRANGGGGAQNAGKDPGEATDTKDTKDTNDASNTSNTNDTNDTNDARGNESATNKRRSNGKTDSTDNLPAATPSPSGGL